MSTLHTWDFMLPNWFAILTLLTLAASLRWLNTRLTRRRLRREGRCTCGYDLRAHHQALATNSPISANCPECGTPITPSAN